MKILQDAEHAVLRQLARQARNFSGSRVSVSPDGINIGGGRGRNGERGGAQVGRILVRLGAYTAGSGYAWTRVIPDRASGTGYSDFDPADSGTRALERNGNEEIAADTIVELVAELVDDDGNTWYGFSYGGTGGGESTKDALFVVTLQSDGGGNGGTSTNGVAATWTYTVKDYETGTTLKKNVVANDDATAMSPIKPRPPWYATAATVGTATRKTDGTLVLVEAFENYDWGTCA